MHPYCDLFLSFFNFLGTRDIPPFGSAENSSVGRKGCTTILVDYFLEFWHKRREISAWLNVSGGTHGLQGGFLFCEAGQVTIDTMRLQLQDYLGCYRPGKWPGVGRFFGCGPRPVGFLPPRLVFMLIVTKLVQLVKVVDVMDELC